ncbi:hypothetical protein MYAM1_001952 [Malassezia yamatoensis]|uniref:Uncharacterized protein n=1 Tax=Malassezia yamatoensis TaxID=253288 RepID=A0AAJ6CHV6_9BASI|nr:hypothetical protein MYAM1_001952 [Malassezia yamatoensis]
MQVRREGGMVRGRSVDTPYGRDSEDGIEDQVELSLLHGGKRAGPQDTEYGLIDEDETLKMVRQVVPETDIPSLPSLTFRSVVLGSLFTVLGAGMSQLFFYKSNAPVFSSYFVILVTLPMARFMANWLPDRTINIFGWSFRLNPGPFSAKEHVLIAVTVSSGATSAYASDIINIQELFFDQHMSALPALTLLITTQVIGFGFAGLVYDLLVRPPAMVYPSTLVTVSLFNTLHDTESSLTRRRMRFFMMVFAAIFVYQFLPTTLFPTLSSIALLCYVHCSRITQILSSGYRGFGILNFSLDWNVAGSSGPLFQPWWAAVNFYAGILGMMYVVMPLLYFSNFWEAQSFPAVLSSGLFTNKYASFDVNAVLKKDNSLDAAAWEQQKPMLLTPFLYVEVLTKFAVLTSTIVHVILWHGKDIKKALFNPVYSDVHNRLMESYPLVPQSWYLTTLGLSLASAAILVATTPLQFPIWGLLLSVGILKAVSDTGVGLNVITEWVLLSNLDSLRDFSFLENRLGWHDNWYVLQLIPGCFMNYAVIRVVLAPENGYRQYLDGSGMFVPDPSGQWDGRKVHIFRSASIIWGAVGPQRFFSGRYSTLYYGFALGVLIPFIPWLLHKRKERIKRTILRDSIFSKTVVPIILHGAIAPPATPTNIILSGLICAFLSQKWAREKHPEWFAKFNYVLSAALDAGSSINALTVFLMSITVFRWWGLPHMFAGQDAEHCQVVSS